MSSRAFPANFMCSAIDDHDTFSSVCTGRAAVNTVSPVHRFSLGVSRITTRFRRSLNGNGHSSVSNTTWLSTTVRIRPCSHDGFGRS